jgi:hypothetical protein
MWNLFKTRNEPEDTGSEGPNPSIPTTPQPPDMVEYRFGYSCPAGHVESVYMTGADIETVSRKHGKTICDQCGEFTKPAIIKVGFTFTWSKRTPWSGFNWEQTVSTRELFKLTHIKLASSQETA